MYQVWLRHCFHALQAFPSVCTHIKQRQAIVNINRWFIYRPASSTPNNWVYSACVFIPLLWEVSQAWFRCCLPLGCILPTCAVIHPLLTVPMHTMPTSDTWYFSPELLVCGKRGQGEGGSGHGCRKTSRTFIWSRNAENVETIGESELGLSKP